MANKKIKVIINGEILELEKNLSITEMLKILNIKPNNIAVECNLQIVSKSQYSSSFISGLSPELRRLFEYKPEDYEISNGHLTIKKTNKAENRLIDEFASNKKISSDYLDIIYWNIAHLTFFLFRVIRKIYRLVRERLVISTN